MLYYKVVVGDKYDYITGYTTVKGELLTPRERRAQFRGLSDACFTPAEVSRKKTYWMFGARFGIEVPR